MSRQRGAQQPARAGLPALAFPPRGFDGRNVRLVEAQRDAAIIKLRPAPAARTICNIS